MTVAAFQASGTAVIATSAGTLTPTWPAGTIAGDIGILVVSGLGNVPYVMSDAQGFAPIDNSPVHDSAVTLSALLCAFWCRAESSSPTAPTVGDAAGDDAKIALIFTLRGCAESGYPFQSTVSKVALSATAVSWPPITTFLNEEMIVGLLAHRIDAAAPQISALANADLTSLTEQVDVDTNTGAGFGIVVVTGARAVAGNVGATTGTLLSASTQALLTIAVLPGPTAAEPPPPPPPTPDPIALPGPSFSSSSALQLADLALTWGDGSADLEMIDSDLASDRGIATAILLSLFTDRRAEDDDQPPSGDPNDRRGWWGDQFSSVQGDRFGSRLWLLDRSKRTEEVRRRAVEYVREATAWILEDLVAASIDVETEMTVDRLLIGVKLNRPGREPVAVQFAHVWSSLT